MKKIFAFIGLSLAAFSCFALEWPVGEIQIVRFFAQRSEGVIEQGITFENADTVRSGSHGTVLLTLEQNSNMSGFPGALGNAVIIAHNDGLLSVYGNLKKTEHTSDIAQIESQTILGTAGTSGWGEPSTLIFQVIDSLEKNMLNPLLLLPSLKDTHSPTIKNVIIISSNNQQASLGSVKIVKQGKYRLYAQIGDTIENSKNELSPFRINVLVNGSESLAIPFELLKENQGRLYVSSPDYYWETLYADPTRLFLGELPLSRGKSNIAIIARDTNGNERSVQFGIQVE